MIAARTSNRSPLRIILIAGLLVGTLDITTAIVVSGAPPDRILRYVASGFFGSEAFNETRTMWIWGLIFHYAIAFSWTVLFFFIFPNVQRGLRHFLNTGVAFGLVIWTVMNLVVVPLSHVSRGPITMKNFLINAAILIVMVGIPLSYLYSRYYSSSAKT